MGQLTPEELQDVHNQGEQDASRGEEKTGLLDEYGQLADGLNDSIIDGWKEERDAYISGVENWKNSQ